MRKIASMIVLAAALSASAQIQNLPEGFARVNDCEATSVKSQDITGTCWSYSTSSFIESEVLRTRGKAIDISEMFTVRNIYMEKAIRYVRYHGIANFSQGALAHDLLHSYEKYGMMPQSAYTGLNGKDKHNHSALEKELKSYLDSLLKSRPIDPHWKDGFAAIMDEHLGAVPAVFEYEGKSYNAKSFADEVIGIDVDDYVGITSFNHQEFGDDFILEVPDNWSDGEYDNVPLDIMMQVIDGALESGYTVEWDGDVSEKGFLRRKGYALLCDDTSALKQVPEVMPEEPKVTQESRQANFDNLTSTDDHLMHIVGTATYKDGRKFYMVKNSWSERAGIEGYTLMSESYMRMKTISIVVHRKSVPKKARKHLDD